jgi:hypothetical protein
MLPGISVNHFFTIFANAKPKQGQVVSLFKNYKKEMPFELNGTSPKLKIYGKVPLHLNHWINLEHYAH